MNCPICNIALQMTDRQGIEIDYCPQCRGIWLDRGELDKIIEKSSMGQQEQELNKQSIRPNSHDDHDYQPHHDNNYKKHKRKSFLQELFD
jgi:Zn-finger nucleic acid-binding protein